MKKLFFLLFALLPWAGTYAQNCLGYNWKITGGDSATWQSADFVPRHWKPINIGVSWERQGYGSYSGTKCLWNEVVIPSGLKDSKNGPLLLRFKFEAESAEVFFNGKSIGSSKQPSGEESFVLPVDFIRWDKPNRILVRIRNHFYTGGACNDYIKIVPEKSTSEIILITKFPNERNVYRDSTDIRFSVSATSNDKQGYDGTQKILIISDFHDTIYHKEERLQASMDEKSIQHSLPRVSPGFYQIQLSFSAKGGSAQRIFWFAVCPEKVIAQPTDEQEIRTFWDNAKRELETITPQFKTTRVDSLCNTQNSVFLAEMKSLNNITIRGWYIVPAKVGVYPAVLHLQGYSAAMNPQWFMEDNDVIHFALDVRGHGRSTDSIHPGFGTPGYVGYNLGDPEKYIYRGAYMDCCRAIDFLLSRQEVDTSRIAVEGHSQGGGLSLATAALCAEKVKFCVTGSPFLSDFANHVKIRTVYMDEMNYYMQNNNVNREQVYKTMNLVDVKNLAPWIKCPVLMGSGLFDDDCPPHINFTAYNNLKTERQYIIFPFSHHFLGWEWYESSQRWLREKFKL